MRKRGENAGFRWAASLLSRESPLRPAKHMEKQKLSREEKSWIMYDWANSVYATIMMAAVFPIYFANIIFHISRQ